MRSSTILRQGTVRGTRGIAASGFVRRFRKTHRRRNRKVGQGGQILRRKGGLIHNYFTGSGYVMPAFSKSGRPPVNHRCPLSAKSG